MQNVIISEMSDALIFKIYTNFSVRHNQELSLLPTIDLSVSTDFLRIEYLHKIICINRLFQKKSCYCT